MSKSSLAQVLRCDTRTFLQERYDRLWLAAIGKISCGNIAVDRVLASGLPDDRRGLTVVARSSPDVRRRVTRFMRELRRIETDQHYYSPHEFHITVLSLFTATAECERFFNLSEQYLAAVDSALQNATPIQIEFAGVTASPDAIMIQGFFKDGALTDLRENLRRQLRVRGLTEGVDTRYRLETAHMTIARFRSRLRASANFAAALERARHLSFGETTIRRVSLVKNDWYMTQQILETVKHYRLRHASSRTAE